MGTRAMYGFYKGGATKATYCHYDGYPTGLGSDVAKFVQETSIDEIKEIFDRIVLVESESVPSNEQIEQSLKYYNPNVSTGQKTEWYSLLRDSQGDLFAYKNGLEFMIDSHDFIRDSLFCEWAYIINLDTNQLEVYEGFQSESEKNRYYDPSVEKESYKNCHLIKELPLHEASPIQMAEIEAEASQED